MNISSPCLVISSLLKVKVELLSLLTVGVSCFLIILCASVVGGTILYFFKLDRSTYLSSLVFSNTGNMGLPMCLFAFGETGLALGIAYFMVTTISQFTLGVMMMTGDKQVIQHLFRQPILYAIIVAVVLLATDTSLPLWLNRPIDLLAGISIPLMLLGLGVSLAQLKVKSFGIGLLLGFGKCGIGFLSAIVVTTLLGLQGDARNVIVLMASMPVAVFNYIFAVRYQKSPEHIAGGVLASTLLIFLLLPLIILFLNEYLP